MCFRRDRDGEDVAGATEQQWYVAVWTARQEEGYVVLPLAAARIDLSRHTILSVKLS